MEIRIRRVTPLALMQLGRAAGFFKPEGRDYVFRTVLVQGQILCEQFVWILRQARAGGADIVVCVDSDPDQADLLARTLRLPVLRMLRPVDELLHREVLDLSLNDAIGQIA